MGFIMIEKIKKDWFEAYNLRNWDCMKNLYADDAIFHAKDGLQKGGESVVKAAKKWLHALTDLQITPIHASMEEDVVIMHWNAVGLFENSIMDIPASRKKVSCHGITCFRIKDDKVIKHWASIDYRPLIFSSK